MLCNVQMYTIDWENVNINTACKIADRVFLKYLRSTYRFPENGEQLVVNRIYTVPSMYCI